MSEKKLILIIDDDPEILRSTKAVLEANGFDAETAISGRDGLESLSRIKPDLILCDMMMERLNTGIRVAQEIREKDREVPIFLMSSIGDVTAMNTDIHEIGFNGVLQKPVNPDTLISALEGTLLR
jgi:two-component system alkaline phosphatase synthesis response regulator PhoP